MKRPHKCSKYLYSWMKRPHKCYEYLNSDENGLTNVTNIYKVG